MWDEGTDLIGDIGTKHVMSLHDGNVGIGTTNPYSALQVEGYIQLDTITGTPPVVDCNEASERGRMKVNNSAELLYVCVNSGWGSIAF